MVNQSNNFESNEYREMFESITKKYEMTYEECKAYKIVLYWNETLRKLFPNFQHGKIAKGDPRKSHAFKYCFKLMRETKDQLHEDEYKLYVYAQLDILRRINLRNNEKPLINVNCLTGTQAWKRWKLWKSKYDSLAKQKKLASKTTKSSISISTEKVIHGLKTTLQHLSTNIGENYNFEQYKEKVLNGDMKRWVILNKISPYYMLLSKFFCKFKNDIDPKKLNIELDVYKVSINENIEQIYEVIFPNEL